MSILDTTIVNVALETLGRELHSTLSDIQWVITGYMLALAAVIPVTGWAARRADRRQRQLALDLLRQPARRRPRLRRRAQDPAAWRAPGSRQARRARARADGQWAAAPHLRARRDRRYRQLHGHSRRRAAP